MSTSTFRDLISEYKTWPLLSAYLTSDAGGSLRVYDRSTPENPFALVRYVKGKSDLSKAHVRLFRSVVWDTLENRPVSVTPFKSVDGEGLPATADSTTDGYTVERFLDGVMIGGFWDRYSNQWRIHTRSTLDAESRYYSQDKTFRQMFDQVLDLTKEKDTLDKSCSYTWVLQHPENRVVVPVSKAMAQLVQKVKINDDSSTTYDVESAQSLRLLTPVNTWVDVHARLSDLNNQFRHSCQGLVVRNAEGQRWKIRTPEYNRVRQMRGNTARRDYLWLSMWRSGEMRDYMTLFPEEKFMANTLVERWKRLTSDVFHFYTDVFKARSMQKTSIPPKYRPFIYGLHALFHETLKPAGKVVVWKTVVEYMNARDVPQMLFALNWDLRQAQLKTGMKDIPLEPPATIGTEVLAEPVSVQRRVDLDTVSVSTDEETTVPAPVPAQAPVLVTPAGGE